jgi:hypothetical protein
VGLMVGALDLARMVVVMICGVGGAGAEAEAEGTCEAVVVGGAATGIKANASTVAFSLKVRHSHAYKHACSF